MTTNVSTAAANAAHHADEENQPRLDAAYLSRQLIENRACNSKAMSWANPYGNVWYCRACQKARQDQRRQACREELIG